MHVKPIPSFCECTVRPVRACVLAFFEKFIKMNFFIRIPSARCKQWRNHLNIYSDLRWHQWLPEIFEACCLLVFLHSRVDMRDNWAKVPEASFRSIRFTYAHTFSIGFACGDCEGQLSVFPPACVFRTVHNLLWKEKQGVDITRRQWHQTLQQVVHRLAVTSGSEKARVVLAVSGRESD